MCCEDNGWSRRFVSVANTLKETGGRQKTNLYELHLGPQRGFLQVDRTKDYLPDMIFQQRAASKRLGPRSNLHSGLREHATHWTRKRFYRPSGTEICSLSGFRLPSAESDPRPHPENTDFKGLSASVRGLFILLVYSVSDPVRSCASSASAFARTSYNPLTAAAANGFF